MIEKEQIKIRQATIDDATAIAAVRNDAIRNINHADYDQSALDEWAGPVEDRVQKLLSNSTDIGIVVEIDDKIIGYGELVTTDNLLSACYVSATAGSQGIGKTIVAELEHIARAKSLDYLQMESPVNAEPFYIRCGYHIIERGKHIMQSGTVMDCVMMRKDLSK